MRLEINKHIFISPTAFKDCISARGLTEMIKSYLWNRGFRNLTSFVGSDGGNGFLDAMSEIYENKFLQIKVPSLLGSQTRTENILLFDSGIAIETASVIGIEQIPEQKRNVFSYTSYPLGVLIRNCLTKFPDKITFHIGIGGTATLDFGLGLLHGLGFTFLDNQKNRIIPTLENCGDIYEIIPIESNKLSFVFYQDVHVPIQSASYSFIEIFGTQKGLNKHQIDNVKYTLNNLISRFSLSTDISGCGGALALFPSKYFPVSFVQGTTYFSTQTIFQEKLVSADIIITGEGKLDESTLLGKWSSQFLTTKKNVLVLTGSVSENLTLPDNWTVESLQSYEPDKQKSIRLVKPLIRTILDKYINEKND